MTRAWIDAGAGASGDMLLGALVGAGAPLETLQSAVDAIGVEPIRLTATTVTRAGLAATKVDVACAETSVVRTLPDIRRLLGEAALEDRVRERALAVFQRLAEAEATVHATTPDDVHFHEVGALDAIADVVGVVTGLDALGIDDLHCSAITLGSGTTHGAHGELPVPAPAVAALLSAAGAPVAGGEVAGEACTPTGAALLATTVTTWGPLPPLTLTNVGVGAGGRDTPGRPNVVRLFLGAPTATTGTAVVLEANIDDLDPRLWPAVISQLIDNGASDAWLTPILMKKGRPAHTLSVLARPDRVDALARVIFEQTSTIGIRSLPVGKRALDRSTATVTVGGIDIRVKCAHRDGEVINAQPEWEDVAAAATALGRPAKAVLAEATAAATSLLRGQTSTR